MAVLRTKAYQCHTDACIAYISPRGILGASLHARGSAIVRIFLPRLLSCEIVHVDTRYRGSWTSFQPQRWLARNIRWVDTEQCFPNYIFVCSSCIQNLPVQETRQFREPLSADRVVYVWYRVNRTERAPCCIGASEYRALLSFRAVIAWREEACGFSY